MKKKELSAYMSKLGKKGGQARAEKLTKEQLTIIGRLGAKVKKEKNEKNKGL